MIPFIYLLLDKITHRNSRTKQIGKFHTRKLETRFHPHLLLDFFLAMFINTDIYTQLDIIIIQWIFLLFASLCSIQNPN